MAIEKADLRHRYYFEYSQLLRAFLKIIISKKTGIYAAFFISIDSCLMVAVPSQWPGT